MERDEFRAWLDQAELSETDRRSDADAAWQRRRTPLMAPLALASLAAAAALTWWLWPESAPPRAPRYDSSLVMTVAGQAEEVRIEVGVRREGDDEQ